MFAPRAVAAVFAGAALVNADSAFCASGSCRVHVERDNALVQLRKPRVSARGCSFRVSPETPHYWEPNCSAGMAGCWADGTNAECRFCSYAGITCPETAMRPSASICHFAGGEPESSFYVEPRCPEVDGGLGCLADGKHRICRWCGGNGTYADIECPEEEEECTFANEPTIPYFYDESCAEGGLGCMADGIHLKCRFCGARPYNSVACPESVHIPSNACWFRNAPAIPYFWDESCTMGQLGCWADGIHEGCRFCSNSNSTGKPRAGGAGASRASESAAAAASHDNDVYSSIPCP